MDSINTTFTMLGMIDQRTIKERKNEADKPHFKSWRAPKAGGRSNRRAGEGLYTTG
jgi:hypothetical protein